MANLISNISQEEVELAIDEYDKIGSEEMFRKYGGRTSKTHYLEYNGRHYPQKLIARAAYGYLPGEQPLKAKGIHANVTRKHLGKLGFTMISI